jgi:uncharacterized protein YndB with AHSA1/START domain
MQDTIVASIEIPVDIEVVWSALTTADGIREWFGDEAEVDLRPGGEARFGWSEYGSSSHAVVVEVMRPYGFSYRWAATGVERADTGPSTLVEFTLSSTDAGTTVTVRESGFASLPPEIIEDSLRENTSGWKSEMQDLHDYLVATAT